MNTSTKPSSGWYGSIVGNPVFANAAAITLIFVGLLAGTRLPRETFPETTVDHIIVTVPYPGAAPADVETNVSIRVEQAIQGIPGVWEITSYSKQDQGLIVAAVNPKVLPTQEVLRRIRNRVEAITTLPPETERPIVNEIIVRNEVISLGVSGEHSQQSLQTIAEQIRDDFLAMPGISQVTLAGKREREISIQLKMDALKRHGLTLQDVMSAVARSTIDLPAGMVRSRDEEITIRTVGQRYLAREFEDLVLIAQAGGSSVRLGQVADIEDSFEQRPVFARVNGAPGMIINVSKTGTEDTIEIADHVRAYVKEAKERLPDTIQLSILSDASRDVDARLQMLFKNSIYGMTLVLICLLLFVDGMSALAVSLGVPVAVAGALIVIWWTGQTLNMITLLGLLMSLGIIVDDAIVIAESVQAESKMGLDPFSATIRGTKLVALPVLMASVTTIVMFVPLLYVEGVMGKFIFVLPIAVIAAIVASGLEAFIILPAHLAEWQGMLKGRRSWMQALRTRIDAAVDWFVAKIYTPLLAKACSNRGLVVAVSIAGVLICAGLVAGGRTPFVLFPKIDGNKLRVRVRFPEGMPIDACQGAVNRIETAAQRLNELPELKPATPGRLVQEVYSIAGEWPEILPEQSSSLCEVNLQLMPAELRRVDSAAVIEHWRKEIGTIPDALSVSISRQELGPTEKPIEIRLLGDDLPTLESTADEVMNKLGEFAGVFDIESKLVPGKREVRVKLKPLAATLGVSMADLSTQIRQSFYGGEAVRIQRGRDDIRVRVHLAESDRATLSALEDLNIRTPQDSWVPFSAVADTQLVRGYSSIARQDGKRRARVYADVDERYANAEQILNTLQASFLPDLAKRSGVTVLLDGQRKRIEESMQSLKRGFVVAIFVMFALLATVLRSYVQPFVIMGAIPLGMVGAVLGHLIMGYDLTLMSIFGMVALSGIVVNDSLVLMDRINRNVESGMIVADAVIDAGRTRFRAVVLTTLTTVAGLVPLMAERSSQAQSLIPLAISIAFGEIFATLLTLLAIPSFFLVVNDAKRLARWMLRGGAFPAPEAVERLAPAGG